MTRLAPKDQDLPSWVDLEAERKKRRPATWVCQDCITRMTLNQQTCTKCGRASQARPKPAPPKPKPPRTRPITPPKWTPEPEIPKLHIRIELSGAMEILLEGEQAKEMRGVLRAGHTANDVIEALDPYSSGITLSQEIRVLEDPVDDEYRSWAVSEERGTFVTNYANRMYAPFWYTTESGKPKPKSVDWGQVQ